VATSEIESGVSIKVLHGKHIVLGVTGSIAAYKAVALASQLVQAGAMVDVIMTHAATKLIQPLSFQAITHRPVQTDMFHLLAETEIGHVTLAKQADLLVIAPATANILARLALGLADDMLSTTALATPAPILVAPAMETEMWANPATQHNVTTLKARGVVVVGPEPGYLASGASGLGRMVEPETLVEHIRIVFGARGDLAGKKIVVTAGGTHEPFDPVRFVGNHSSGKMGYALAERARDRGAQVTLISGPTALTPPLGVNLVNVRTAEQMRAAVFAALPDAAALIMAAAVADYRPMVTAEHKLKKTGDSLILELVRNPDILAGVTEWRMVNRSTLITVGFAAESDDLIENARAKLKQKRLDLIVANPVPETFGEDRSQAILIDREGNLIQLDPLPKGEVAEIILDRVSELLRVPPNIPPPPTQT